MKNCFAIRLIHADEVRPAARAGLVLRVFGLACAIVCFASAAIAQNRYQITRIPVATGTNSAALGVNNKGEVVGYSFQGDDYQAFLYSFADKSMTDVGSFGGKLNAACAINDAGQVTGYSQDANGNLFAFIFSRNTAIASLGTLNGGSSSEAFGINSHGAVVGDSQSGNQNHHPALFSNSSVQDLGLGASNDADALETAYAINDSGQIVGRHAAGNNAFHAFLFAGSSGNTTDFGTLGGANGEALAINKNGQVVGDSDTANGPAHAFLFDGSLKDLGTLPGFDNASYARGINNSGEVVGESDSADQKRAFLYTKGQLVELDRLAENLTEAGFASLDVAYGINDKGWIVGYGTTPDNVTAAFVAIPERGRGNPEPQVAVPQPQPQPQGQPVAESSTGDDYSVFYSKLSSEGSWVEAGGYGYCFRPRVASGDWRPYRDGHWVWTDRGWFWDSSEHFGWATYHYGRWVSIAGTGWCWVPGHQWAPAWVSWRESGEHVGWAPLPPEASISVQVGISSWSDSYYGVGPSAYTFIRYQDWSAPNYAQRVLPPAQNVQIISQTKNITNIVTNNTVINNYGPQVQTVAAKTNQNIQQVKLVVNPATGANANYGHTLNGTQLNVVAPPATLKPVATQPPVVQNRIANPTVEKGWQDVKPADADKLKKTIAEQNPVPANLPKSTPFATPQILNKGQVGSASPTGSPTPNAGQKQPPNLVKPFASPGGKSPGVNVTPSAAPGTSVAGKRSIPPNLLGAKPSGTPHASPAAVGGKPTPLTTAGPKVLPTGGKILSTPGGAKPSPTETAPSGAPGVPKATPPNLNLPKTSPAPERPKSEENKPFVSPTPKTSGGTPPAENPVPHVSATPHVIATPTPEKKLETTPTPHREPTNLEPPKPTSTPHHEPANVATPKSTPEVKATPRETEKEIKTLTPRPTPEKNVEEKPEVHPSATPHKNEGGKEEGKHPKGSATPEKKE